MTAGFPEEVVDGFGAALCAGDVGAATALFSREGCFVTPDSTVIRGRSQIRGFLQQMIDLATDLRIDQRTMVKAGDVAVGSEAWRLRLGQGEGMVRTTRAMIVLGRIEGSWRIAVADPWRV
ncbi:MAG TPA: nuclear transport factor 2 family protein [Solirubrobacterales bacterium]|nr:nuclear transport factor 2 family protein [Solirubrobacterales bacterium]